MIAYHMCPVARGRTGESRTKGRNEVAASVMQIAAIITTASAVAIK